MQEEQPIYSAQHARSFFQRINMAIVAAVVVFGILSVNFILVLLGIAIGLLYWFTTGQQYHVYADRLVITYGRPRILIIPFDSVQDVSIVKVPLSAGVFVRRTNRPGVIIRPRGMEEFVGILSDAVQRYIGRLPEGPPPDDGSPAGE